MNVGVLGLGYVGTVTAACLAKLEHTVIGVDIDAGKVNAIREGEVLFYEPGLDALVWEQVQANHLSAATEIEDIAIADIIIICVGTPVENGDVNLKYLNQALASLKDLVFDDDRIIVIRSTVPPGTCAKLQESMNASLLFVPEFLREGSAIEDFENASLCVVGCKDKITSAAAARVGKLLFKSFKVVDWGVAEMLKYACNAFHALKICFANEIDAIATTQGVDGKKVMELLKADKRLNSSSAYLRPGFAFGGSCLKKDITALRTLAADGEVDACLINSILGSNSQQIFRAVEVVEATNCKKIGIIGLAFKENTDDVRNSEVIHLIRQLNSKEIKVYAPVVNVDKLHGVNLEELQVRLQDYKEILVSLEELLGWAEVIVITHKVSMTIEEAIYTSTLKIIDLSGHYQTRL